MVRPITIFTALFLLLTSLVAIGQVRGYFPKPGPDFTAQDVSIVQLIADPQRFHGKRVRFIGFLRIEFEGNAIYLHREDFERSISQNGLWVNIPRDMTKEQKRDTNMQYVICVGTFRADRHGHMDMFSGEIDDVKRLELWSEKPRSSEKVPRSPQ